MVIGKVDPRDVGIGNVETSARNKGCRYHGYRSCRVFLVVIVYLCRGCCEEGVSIKDRCLPVRGYFLLFFT